MVARKFGRLVVIAAGPLRGRRRTWRCRCACGRTCTVREDNLKSGNSKSCGCQKRKGNRRTHGLTGTSIHGIWLHMLDRCNNPRNRDYLRYGDRGISVCSRWQGKNGFANFFADMGDRPISKTLDRRDNDGDYSPGNCRWATKITQSQNRRTSRYLKFGGKNLCLSEWSRRTGVGASTLRLRLAAGWSVRQALTMPVRRRLVSEC